LLVAKTNFKTDTSDTGARRTAHEGEACSRRRKRAARRFDASARYSAGCEESVPGAQRVGALTTGVEAALASQ